MLEWKSSTIYNQENKSCLMFSFDYDNLNNLQPVQWVYM